MKEAITLGYDRGLKAFPLGAVTVLLVVMLSVFVFIGPDPEGYPEGVWIFLELIFAGIVLPWLLFIEVFGTRAVLNEEGIRAESLWRGTRFLRWREVERAYYSSFSELVILKGGGGKIRIHPWMSNIDQLLAALNEMVPEERIHENLKMTLRHLRSE